jgi:hypothetical protein
MRWLPDGAWEEGSVSAAGGAGGRGRRRGRGDQPATGNYKERIKKGFILL